MIKLLRKVFRIPLVPTHNRLEYEYLCNSTDLVDLERRQRNIQFGAAPWQKH